MKIDIIEKAKKSIKHPHFYYASIDKNNNITLKKKKWYKWLSGKRIVAIEIKSIEIKGLANYRKE